MIQTIPIDTDISLVASPLFGVTSGGKAVLAGTAVIVAPHLAVTAAHVITDFVAQFFGTNSINILNDLQVEGRIFGFVKGLGGVWIPFTVHKASLGPPSDLALLTIALAAETDLNWSLPRIQLPPPSVGSQISGFGFAKTNLTLEGVVRDGESGVFGSLSLEPSTTSGVVREVHVLRRDDFRLNFPCFETNARFDGGMSGGPIFCNGLLCGVICSSLPATEEGEEDIGYGASLWPLLAFKTDFDSEDGSGKLLFFDVLKPMGYVDLRNFAISRETDPPSVSMRIPRTLSFTTFSQYNPELVELLYEGRSIFRRQDN